MIDMINVIVMSRGGELVWLSELRPDLYYVEYENIFGEIIYY